MGDALCDAGRPTGHSEKSSACVGRCRHHAWETPGARNLRAMGSGKDLSAACGAEDGRRPPAGDVPAAAGGGLDLVENVLTAALVGESCS